MLCIHCTYGCIRQLALDTLSNIAVKVCWQSFVTYYLQLSNTSFLHNSYILLINGDCCISTWGSKANETNKAPGSVLLHGRTASGTMQWLQ